MAERQIEVWLGKRLKNLGCLYYKFVSPGNSGVPDRIIVLPGGKTIFVELKADGGQLSALQRYQIDRLNKQGSLVFVVSGVQDAKALVEIIRRMVWCDYAV